MWRRLRPKLSHLWRRLQKGRGERRTAEARTRFWAEVREGQREAEALHLAFPSSRSARTVPDLSCVKMEGSATRERERDEQECLEQVRIDAWVKRARSPHMKGENS